MSEVRLSTRRLQLTLHTIEETMQRIAALSPDEKKELSDAWLTLVRDAEEPAPWIHGFVMLKRDEGMAVGECGFKGPPDSDGMVEIAYAVTPDQQGRGYATEAASAMIEFALSRSNVHRVCAHTLPEANASTRVLTKCGMECVGEVTDPDDGLVWRWERRAEGD